MSLNFINKENILLKEPNSLLDFNEIAICISELKKKQVFYQNNICKSICGDMESKSCNLCKDIYFQDEQVNISSIQPKVSTFVAKRQYIAGRLCDIFKFTENNTKEITVLYPVKDMINKYLTLFKDEKFTARETEIGLLILEKKSNLEIQKKLYISKSTLKTHLNHMYQKLPDLKSIRLKKEKPKEA